MNLLFLNAAFRDNSRTLKLANAFLDTLPTNVNITEINLGTSSPIPLTKNNLEIYLNGRENSNFSDFLFSYAKQFQSADMILIAAPFWNYNLPAVLYNYIELTCAQGITFDMSPDGKYYSLIKAKSLVFVTTAGGEIPEENHAFGYIKQISKIFWEIPNLYYFKADCLDIVGNDSNSIMSKTISEIKNCKIEA